MATQDKHREREAHLFFRQLYGDYGERAPGFLSIWSRHDRLTRWIPAKSLDIASQVVVKLAQSQDVYFGVGLQPRDFGPNRRGQGRDVIGIPGFWADIDVQGTVHKATDLPPTKADGFVLIRQFPLQPTLVVDSGHGLQAWWLFKEPWVFRDDDERRRAQNLVRRFQRTLQQEAKAQGWRIDNTGDLARVLRPDGTWNRKSDPVRVRTVEMVFGTRRYAP